jgi:hypothetical protein
MVLDIRAIRERVQRARQQGGREPTLLAYDANAIQQFVTASSRPVAMRGASATVDEFDAGHGAEPGCVFAGGGRGLLVVDGLDTAQERGGRLQTDFAARTFGGSLAVAFAPYRPDAEHASLRWLQQRLTVAKDEAPPPRPPGSGRVLCEDCHEAWGTLRTTRTNASGLVCGRCAAMADVGRARRLADEAATLADLSQTNQVVALSADGNEMGRLFSALSSLEAVALASEAVRVLFRDALEDAARACSRGHGVVPLVAGGDDIRAYLGPEDLLSFASTFAAAVSRRGEALGTLAGALPGDGLARVGVGIGAAMAGESHPASQLMSAAHALEKQAKRLCRDDGARSAFAFVNLLSGEALREGEAPSNVVDLDPAAFAAVRQRAEALASVPATQRQQVLELRRGVGPEEFANAFRYQVARSREWQAFLAATGVDFRDRAAVVASAPAPFDEELARLVTKERGAEARRARQGGAR